MAVEAPHLNLLTTQLLISSRELAKAMDAQPAMLGINCAVDKGLAFFSSDHPASFYSLTAAPSGSGLTDAAGIGKKRPREPTFLPDDDLPSLVHQHMLDLDRLLTVHTERVRSELTEWRQQFARQLAAAAAEDGILKRLIKAKDDEIERAKRLNWALEDQVHSLAAENQAWREIAQTNETAANHLRANLEQVLAAELRDNEEEEEEQRCGADAEDAESCCCGESDGPRDPTPMLAAKARACRRCGEGELSVLLLPCRHLCLCSACGPATNSCPICKCPKKGSVNVNLA